ncbi:HDOD domain-containing protein [Pseudomonas sp. TE3610]
MSELAEMVQGHLLAAIENDDLVLPTLPEVALRIREAAEDMDISVPGLGKVIGRDPALAARLIKVVNSPMLRATQEITDLNGAINRLGINYSSNLAIGLVIEQIFHARSPVVQAKMHDVWCQSLEVAGVSYEVCRRHTSLKPDQAALAGLVHQIGVLPILTYAQDHNELLSDPICLNHVIERIHPLLGGKILSAWEFSQPLVLVPGQYLDLARRTPEVDYADVVQIARLVRQHDYHRLPDLPAYQHLNLGEEMPIPASEVNMALGMFR